MRDDEWRNRPGMYAGIKQRQELAGILRGILADKMVNVRELAHLATWLRDQYDELGPDFEFLREKVDDVLADGRVESDEEADLWNAIRQALDQCQTMGQSPGDHLARELVGVLKGVTADQVLNACELDFLKEELATALIAEHPLMHTVRLLIDQYDSDPYRLYRSLCAVAGHEPEEGVVGGLSIGGIFDDPCEPEGLVVTGASFCFTGTFVWGSRKLCAQRVVDLGGSFQKNLTTKTDYLVVGAMETRAWAATNYGRKIEAALDGRKTTGSPWIISEMAWHQALLRAETQHRTAPEVDPERFFAEWVYPPNRAQRAALGIRQRDRVDPERTRIAREKAKGRGLSDKQVAKIRLFRRSWTTQHPPNYDFRTGDLFRATDGRSIQVIDDGDPLEVHNGTKAYQLSPAQLAHWLRTGVEPLEAEISPYQCKSELYRFLIAKEAKKCGCK